MPEGPEVTLMVERLSNIFNNSNITNIILLNKKLNIGPIDELNNILPLKIIYIKNKGKFVYFLLSGGWSLGFTLGMTGYFYSPTNDFIEYKTYNCKNNKVLLETTNGNIYFNDVRGFGKINIYSNENKNILEDKLDRLGPDLIKDLSTISYEEFNNRLSKFRDTSIIADVLLEQKFISGVGNYIRAESLYDAKIAPLRTIGSLDESDRKNIKISLEKIGKLSYLSQKDKKPFEYKVYGKISSNKIKRKNRTIWWDSSVQK